MDKPVKCDADILNLLKKTDNRHIDYLVDVLTDNGKGRIALSSSDTMNSQRVIAWYQPSFMAS